MEPSVPKNFPEFPTTLGNDEADTLTHPTLTPFVPSIFPEFPDCAGIVLGTTHDNVLPLVDKNIPVLPVCTGSRVSTYSLVAASVLSIGTASPVTVKIPLLFNNTLLLNTETPPYV